MYYKVGEDRQINRPFSIALKAHEVGQQLYLRRRMLHNFVPEFDPRTSKVTADSNVKTTPKFHKTLWQRVSLTQHPRGSFLESPRNFLICREYLFIYFKKISECEFEKRGRVTWHGKEVRALIGSRLQPKVGLEQMETAMLELAPLVLLELQISHE